MSEEINDKVTKNLVEKYLNLTKRARGKISSFEKQTDEQKNMTSKLLSMADDYISDANHFFK